MDFKNAQELLELCKKENCPISSIMKKRECILSETTEEAITAQLVDQHRRNGNSVCGSVLSRTITYSMAVLETNTTMGLIVAAPTAGSSGVLPGLLEFLEILKNRQIRIGIGMDMTASIQYKKLLKLGLTPYINFIVTSQEAGVEKPHSHFFDVCLEKADCLPEECAFIGDNRKKDVQGALDHRMRGIWYSQEKVPEKNPDFPVIVSYTDTKEFLKLLKETAPR